MSLRSFDFMLRTSIVKVNNVQGKSTVYTARKTSLVDILMAWNGMQWPTCQEPWQKHRLLISSLCENLVQWASPSLFGPETCLKIGRVQTHGPGGNWRLW